MPTTSHPALINVSAAPPPVNAGALADAFSEFMATSARLESSYRTLQGEVLALNRELADRNAENQRMRLALEHIVDSMPSGVIVAARDGSISTINPESLRLLNLSADDLPATLAALAIQTGLPLHMVAAEADTTRELQIDSRWLEVRTRRLSGATVTAQIILILRDVTAQKRAEHDRESGRNALALAEVSTILAHEMRNPLASLELFSELIELDDRRRGEWISNLRAGIRTLSATVNNVLAFHSSSHQPAASLRLAPLPLAAVISRAIDFMHPVAQQAGIVFQWWNGDSELLIQGNDSALQQVLLNLFANAIRHTPEGGTVTISLQLRQAESGARVLLECVDTGPGILPSQIGRIFEPGFSGSGDRSGLGLAVCERILRQHNATISAKSLPGTGTSFRIDFPSLSLPEVAA